MYKIMQYIFVVLFLLSFNSKEIIADSPKELFQKWKDAVVKIELLQQGIPVKTGTAFFISSEGHLVTSQHILSAISSPGFSIQVQTYDGQVIRDVLVGTCGNDTGIDLCILKTKYNPKTYFRFNNDQLSPGERVYVIGHPRGYTFSLSEGLLSGYRTTTPKIHAALASQNVKPVTFQEMQFTAPVSPGNSGGPVFDSNGKLLGIVTWIRVDQGSQNLNFAISSKEVWKFITSSKKFITQSELSKKRADKLTSISNTLKDYIKPAYQDLDHNRPLDKKVFWHLEVKVDQKNYLIPLPSTFTKELCKTVQLEKHFKVVCYDMFFAGTIYIDFILANSTDALQKINGMKSNSKPLPIVENLKAAGQWDAYKAKLNDTQIKYLHSIHTPFKCEPPNPKNKIFDLLRNATTCKTRIYNDGDANISSMVVSSQIAGDKIAISFTGSSDPYLAGYFYDATTIAWLGTKVN